MSRLDQGGLIDRARPLSFTFDGRPCQGFAGDTLASALVANDIRLVARSFKYHRPRGIMTAGNEEPNALLTIGEGAGTTPNTRATTVELYDGLIAHSQNRWPSLAIDAGEINALLSPIFVAGFYYKTFMWPAALWEKLYEPLIRRAAGLGRLSGAPDRDRYDKAHGFCDLLVIGGGAAGLSAALAAGRAGARVILVEEDFRLGGRLLAERDEVDGQPAAEWAAAVEAELETLPNVRILRRTALFGVYDGQEYGAVERIEDGVVRQRLWKIVAKNCILATGAIERGLLFAGNDRPGVMLASASRTYLNRFAAAPGRRIAMHGASDDGWRTVIDMAAAGIEVAAIVDARNDVPETLVAAARRTGARILLGARVVATHGHRGLRRIDIRTAEGKRERFTVDHLAVAGGWNPAIGLACHLGQRPVWSDTLSTYVIDRAPPGMRAAGAAAGRFTLVEALADGIAAAAACGFDGGSPAPPSSHTPSGGSAIFSVAGKPSKAFIDHQHDVTAADVDLAAREGFRSVEHMKRYTTLGMATDQGRTSQLLGNAVLAASTGREIAATGTILSRPPYTPVAIAAFAGLHRGEHFRPVRHTPSHDWATEHGAVFVDAGAWKRAQYYPRPGERDWLETVSREAAAVRHGVGICDVSTLGKIEIQGPDAGALLDRLYINGFSKLAIGKARYGLMLREDGFVLDDGTVTRFAENRFFLTTTTANAARVMQHIDHCRQVVWPELDVQAVSVTERWAQFAIAGPRSRLLIERMLSNVDLSNAAFPFMAAVECRWRGHPARLYRLSFSGELAYELAVPAPHGDALARALMKAGRDLDVTPYGTEALGVLRIEKGHAAGNELNGQTTAADLGMARMLSTRKDFIGRLMAERPALNDPARPALVGVRPVDGTARLRAGAHLLPIGAEAAAANDQGHVTSVAFSPVIGGWIGLALLAHGPSRIGEHVRAYDPVRGGDTEVIVCDPVFVDPKGERLRG